VFHERRQVCFRALFHKHEFIAVKQRPAKQGQTVPLREFALAETRFSMLARSDKERSEHLLTLAQADADERWRLYSQLAGMERTVSHEETPAEPDIAVPEK
jgi:pyruvate/2-oxoacid:ferredoxin oxidoreductase beta subunit